MDYRKLSKILAIFMLSTFVLTSCKDDKKEAEKIQIENERVEKEAAEKVEREEAELRAKQEAILNEAREKSINSMAMKTEDLSTLSTALQSAELNKTLSEPGNYTVFAPSNHAFSKLPKAKLDALLLPENKDMLTSVLQYHVVSGKITSDQLAAAIKGGNGSYTFKTITGEELTASMKGDQFIIQDGTGKKAQVILGNQEASNGIVHVIDAVLMAKK